MTHARARRWRRFLLLCLGGAGLFVFAWVIVHPSIVTVLAAEYEIRRLDAYYEQHGCYPTEDKYAWRYSYWGCPDGSCFIINYEDSWLIVPYDEEDTIYYSSDAQVWSNDSETGGCEHPRWPYLRRLLATFKQEPRSETLQKIADVIRFDFVILRVESARDLLELRPDCNSLAVGDTELAIIAHNSGKYVDRIVLRTGNKEDVIWQYSPRWRPPADL